MRTSWATSLLLTALSCATAFSQQIAFTSRTYFESPVDILSVEDSKAFGYESVALRNASPDKILAVRFRVTFRTSAGDEVVEERRTVVNLQSHESRKLNVGLAEIAPLKLTAKSRNQESALAILTIESVEFENGAEWKKPASDPDYDPVQAVRPRK